MTGQVRRAARRLHARHEAGSHGFEVTLLARGIEPVAHIPSAACAPLAVIMLFDAAELAAHLRFAGVLQRSAVSGFAGQPAADGLDGAVDYNVACRRARACLTD